MGGVVARGLQKGGRLPTVRSCGNRGSASWKGGLRCCMGGDVRSACIPYTTAEVGAFPD